MAENVPMELQRTFWNAWNAANREAEVQDISHRQADIVLGWLAEIGRRDLDLLEAGCGTGWLCQRLVRFGRVTAIDLSDEVLDRARARVPGVEFLAGDVLTLDLKDRRYDVVISLEVLAHVADQAAFMRRLADLLRPGGHLMLATQNRPVLERFNRIPPPAPGQLRRWLDREELARLVQPMFEVEQLFTVMPKANRGLMRLVNSHKLNRPIKAVVGNRLERLKEHLGLGCTLMLRARRLG